MLLLKWQPSITEILGTNLGRNTDSFSGVKKQTRIMWVIKWIIAKTQILQIKVYIIGIDMSIAFNTIRREQLIDILKKFKDEDEVRMIQLSLSNTTLDVRINNAETEPFIMGSQQGDALSGVLFNIYFEKNTPNIKEF